MSYQKITGPLMAHSVSYDGQDAYNDMFVTEKKNNELGRIADSTNLDLSQCGGGVSVCRTKAILMQS